MLSLPVPLQNIRDVYPACVNHTRDKELRDALHEETERVLLRAAIYEAASQRPSFHEVEDEEPQNVTAEQLAGLYTRVFVSGGERTIYLALKSASFLRRCPFCVQRDVQTLDHYLPRTNFPEFAVLPQNLVPSCFECNHAKQTYCAETHDEQLFHPYYDNWSDLNLLCATVEFNDGIQIIFHVNHDGLSQEVRSRMTAHFTHLNLGTLYSQNAAVEIIQKRALFEMTFLAGGGEALRQDLLFEAQSRETPFPNAWQPVLYRALAGSEMFWSGGFRHAVDRIPA